MLKLRTVLLVTAAVSVLAAPMAMAAKGDMTFGLNGGAALPIGDYKDFFKTGFGGGVFGDYWVHEQFGVGINLGYVQNKGKDEPGVKDPKASIIEAEVHGKWTPPMKDSKLAPYLEFGGGLHRAKFEASDSTTGASFDTTMNKFGFHVGGGVGYKASPGVTVGIGASFHVVPSALEIVDPTTLAVEKKSLQYLKVGIDVTFATTGAK